MKISIFDLNDALSKALSHSEKYHGLADDASKVMASRYDNALIQFEELSRTVTDHANKVLAERRYKDMLKVENEKPKETKDETKIPKK